MTSLKGGKGSGNFGHKGRPGERGGSSSVRIGEGIRSGNSMYSLDAGIAYSGLDNIDVPSLKDDEIYLVRFSTAREDISGKVGLFAYGGKHLDDVINATQAYADRAGGKGYLIIGRYSDPDWDIPLEQESDGVEVNSVLGTEFAPIDLVVPVSLRSSTKSLLPLIIRSALVLDQRGRLDSETKVRVLKALESSWNLEKKSGSATDGHNAAGLLVASRETGRVLMIQRALDETDPHSGEWEFPGGRIEPGETPLEAAKREWMEETGYQLPQGRVVGTWDCGGYVGYVYSVGLEGDIQGLRDRVINPDDPDRDKIEALAWWDVDQLRDNPAVREEVRSNLALMVSALDGFELKGGKGSGNFVHRAREGESSSDGIDFTPDLALWEKRVLHLLDQGRKPNPRPFKSDTIPEEIKSLIEDGLELVMTKSDVKSLFEFVKGGEGSGNFGHKGRPGEVGGSSSSKLDPFDEKDETFFSDWIRESWDTFSYDEQMAFEAYGDGHYREINSLLRSGEYRDGRGETDTQIERMLEAMYRSPAPENFVVYRGTNLSINLDDPDPRRVQLLELLDSKIADPDVEVLFSDQGFLSTSVSRSAADSFYATGKVESDIAGVPIKTIHALRLTIHVPKGMPVAPIYNSEYSDELEVLLPPGQQFRVTSISRKLSPLSSLPDSPKTPAYHYELVLEVAP